MANRFYLDRIVFLKNDLMIMVRTEVLESNKEFLTVWLN